METSSNIVKDINLSVFEFFNQTFGKPIFDQVMIIANSIADPHFIHYHLILISIIGSIMLYCKRNNQAEFKELAITGFSTTTTFLLSGIILVIGLILKSYTEMPRPFCSLHNIYTLTKITNNIDCLQSFPSGHVTLSTMLIISFWPLFNRPVKYTSIILVIIIAITRMASGAHYPIDIIAALVLTVPFTLYISEKTNILTRYYEKKWNIFDYLFKRVINTKN